jgi:dipeptidyl aminopeptidase/acylaminoacyl peptidase
MSLLSHSILKWLLIASATVAALGGLFAARVIFNSYMGEREDFLRAPSGDISRHPELTGIRNLVDVTITEAGGLRLAAWYAAPSNGAAIVLVHGTSADRTSLLAETRLLAAAGFGVLALDLPGQGASEGRTLWGPPEQQAISAAVTWLTLRPEVEPSRIGGFGFSMGAYVLTQAAVADNRLHSVVLAASPSEIVQQTRLANSRWGWLSEQPALLALRNSGMPVSNNQPIQIIGSISPRSVLILGGDADNTVPEYMARALYESAREPKELWILRGAHHGDYIGTAPGDYPHRLIGFFRRTLLADWQ